MGLRRTVFRGKLFGGPAKFEIYDAGSNEGAEKELLNV